MDHIQTESAPELDQDESDLDDGLTALEYARLQSIALDHLNPEIPLSDLRAAHQAHENSSINQAATILEDEKLATVSTLIPADFTDRKDPPSFSRESFALLATITGRVGTNNEVSELEEIVSGLLDGRKKGARTEFLELPVLRSDHELDVACWGGREEPVVEDLNVPREPIDERRGEGLGWGKEMMGVVGKIKETIIKERIALEADDFAFLMASLRDDWCEDDNRGVWESVIRYKRNMAREPLTPPLQPMSPPTTPFVPSSPVMELPLLSDPASLISADLQAAEAEIFKDDTIVPFKHESKSEGNESSDTVTGDADIELAEVYSPLASIEAPQASPLPQRTRRASDLKVEVPLTPPIPAPLPKTVKFNDIVEEMLLDVHPDDGGASTQASQNASQEEDQRFFLDAIGPIAEAVDRKVQQEQLKSADSLGRVKIPLMDFSLPPPPWVQLQEHRSPIQILAFQRALIRDVIEQHSVPPVWRGSKKMEKQLRWVPFPSELGKVAIDEQLDSDGDLAELLSVVSIKAIGDSSSLTWKPEGLRILREEDEDDDEGEELELGHFSEKQERDMSSLLKKRKLEFMEDRKNTDSRNSNFSGVSGTDEYRAVETMVRVKEPRNKRRKSSPLERVESPYLPAACQALLTMPHKRPSTSTTTEKVSSAPEKAAVHTTKAVPTAPNLLLGGIFSAGNALDNFMEIRGSKKQKLQESTYFVPAPKKPSTTTFQPAQKSATTETHHPPTTHAPIPIPKITPSPHPLHIIISSPLLSNRPLIRHLTTHLPTLKIYERDFSAYNTTIWAPNTGTISRSPITSPLASEADIIISSSTAILLTTLQAIKQKPLPGSKTRNKVLERITAVVARYERLVVFVQGMGMGMDMGVLGDDDCGKLAEFIGFCSAPFSNYIHNTNQNPSENNSQSPEILVNYIPSSSPEILATYIASTLSKYSPIGSEGEAFLAEETVWELWLRRAGINAWAAQSVIGALKEGNGESGIRAFVKMGGEERIRRFEALMGGRRVLERVGRAVDARWGSRSGSYEDEF